jgi:hypothetical protein
MIRLEKWQDFKTVLDQYSIKPYYIDYTSHYYLSAENGSISFDLVLFKSTPANSDQTDFETNYLPDSNPDPKVRVTIVDPITVGATTLNPNYTSIDSSFTKIDLNRYYQSYNTIYDYSGTGKLYGFSMDFNSDNILIKLTIDGNSIFDIDLECIEDMTGNGDDEGGSCFCNLGWINWNADRNIIKFKPPYPISYSSNIKIEAKANSNTSSRDMTAYLIDIVKES